jgi:hypothetical protein
VGVGWGVSGRGTIELVGGKPLQLPFAMQCVLGGGRGGGQVSFGPVLGQMGICAAAPCSYGLLWVLHVAGVLRQLNIAHTHTHVAHTHTRSTHTHTRSTHTRSTHTHTHTHT